MEFSFRKKRFNISERIARQIDDRTVQWDDTRTDESQFTDGSKVQFTENTESTIHGWITGKSARQD